MLRRAVIVGASSGIGAALARRLVRDGFRVALVARRAEVLSELCDELNRGQDIRRAFSFVHDVTDPDTAEEVFDAAVAALDGLDCIVYAAGVMPRVALDEYDTATDQQIMAVNVSGAMAWINPAARRFEIQRGGMIVGIGSVAGDRGRIKSPAYCASKAALHTWLESLRNRLARKGVQVITIKPGPVRTPMTEGLDSLPMVIEAPAAADRIVAAMRRGTPTAYVPLQWWPIMSVIRAIPSVVFRRMSI